MRIQLYLTFVLIAFSLQAEEDYPWADYLKNSADWFKKSEAIKIADECIKYQVSGEGGWQKGMKTSHTDDWAHSTIDNDVTTSQIRFLMRTYVATGDSKYLSSAKKGLDCLFKMQYSNGGFMQNLNTPGTYHAHITLNDAAYLHVLQVMKEVSTKTGDFTKIDDTYKSKGASSYEKAIKCLLNMQVTQNGVKTAWGQQHDENTLKPAAARAYELESLCTSESAGIIEFLYEEAKATGRSDLKQCVNAAINWFNKVKIQDYKWDWNSSKTDKELKKSSGTISWARFYELGTDKPLFSDRDGKKYFDVKKISLERRTGYGWYGTWGKNVIKLKAL